MSDNAIQRTIRAIIAFRGLTLSAFAESTDKSYDWWRQLSPKSSLTNIEYACTTLGITLDQLRSDSLEEVGRAVDSRGVVVPLNETQT